MNASKNGFDMSVFTGGFYGFNCVQNTCIAIAIGETASDPSRPIPGESRVPVIILIGYVYIYIGLLKEPDRRWGGGISDCREIIDRYPAASRNYRTRIDDNAADAGITAAGCLFGFADRLPAVSPCPASGSRRAVTRVFPSRGHEREY